MVRVAVSLASLVPGRLGGSERYARELLVALADGGGVRVTALVPPAAWEAYRDLGNVRRLPAGVPAGGAPRAAALCAGLVAGRALGRRVTGFDVIHHPFTVPLLRPRAPSVVSLHDVAHHELPEMFPAAERAFRRLAYDEAARRATVVIAPSEHVRGAIVSRLGVAERRVVAIPYGVDFERFAGGGEGEASAAALAGLDLPARYLLYPANLWPHKNHLRLVAALGRVADRDLALVLSGQPGPRLGEIRDAAARAGVLSRVLHVGQVPASLLPALYRCAHAVVIPSLSEGFGFPVVEAMAAGVPVAAADRTALPEVCGGAAVLFDPFDVDAIAAAIERVAGDAALRDRLRAAGRRRARELSWARVAERHRAVYRGAAVA